MYGVCGHDIVHDTKKSKGKNEEIFFQYLETMTAYSKMSVEAFENEYNSNMSWLFQCLLSK